MKTKATWLLPFALLIICHGSLTAQKSADAREWLTTADRSALFAEQKDTLHFSSPANAFPAIEVNDMAAVPVHGWFRFRPDRRQRAASDAYGARAKGGPAQAAFFSRRHRR